MPTPPNVEEAAARDEGLRALAWENVMTVLSLKADQLGRARWDSINAARRAAGLDTLGSTHRTHHRTHCASYCTRDTDGDDPLRVIR